MKKNNSLLITILSGAIFCFVCLGMVFLFPSSTKKLNSSNESAFPNADEHGYVPDEEISLGDTTGCSDVEETESCSCSSGTHIDVYCYTGNRNISEPSTCVASGGLYAGGKCYSSRVMHTCTTTTRCTKCDQGRYLTNDDTCAVCQAGSYCGGGTARPQTCPAGTYSNDGARECSQCNRVKEYSASGASSCSTCTGDQVANSSHTGCVDVAFSCPSGYSADEGATSNSQCYKTVAAGYSATWNGSSHTMSACAVGSYATSSRKVYYGKSSGCTPCGEGKTTSSTGATSESQCVADNEPIITCLNPKYTGANQTIATCANGTITSGAMAVEHGSHWVVCQGSNKSVSAQCPIVANDGVVCCCTADKSMCSWQNSCSASKPSPVQGVTSESDCKSQESGDIPNNCTVSASISSVATSVAEDGESDPNSYYTVTVKIRGRDCGGQTVSYVVAQNGKQSPSSYKISENAVSVTTSFYVRPIDPCSASSAYARLSNGAVSNTVTLGKDAIRTDWKKTENVCEKNPQYTAFYLADMDGANVYYSNYDSSQGCYTVKWRRYLCGSGGTPTTPTTPEAPHCYTDDDGNYYWTLNPDSNWKIVDNITKEDNCKKEETEACYLTPSGTYEWGKHAKDDGYTLITAITTSSACKAPVAEDACYKKDNDYIWTTSAPEGYEKVENAKTPAECTPPETPACYLHGNSFVWGKYEKVSGYIFVENIDEEANCKKPDTDACYVDSKGDYVWGKYGDAEGYTLVPSVTEMSQCKNDVPTPKTDISISKIIYIFMAILMAFGVGFIYYSSTAKKSS